MKIKDIEDEKVRNEMIKKFNRVMTPTIVINRKKYIGFEENLESIKKELNIE
ncbi:MAG: hypothetical protein FH761_11830 [Firmicutes bacterium]|nr:hypothetical protein [Bacillota bacterium]